MMSLVKLLPVQYWSAPSQSSMRYLARNSRSRNENRASSSNLSQSYTRKTDYERHSSKITHGNWPDRGWCLRMMGKIHSEQTGANYGNHLDLWMERGKSSPRHTCAIQAHEMQRCSTSALPNEPARGFWPRTSR